MSNAAEWVDNQNREFLAQGSRYLMLTDADGSVLYAGETQANEMPATDAFVSSSVTHSGYFDEQQAYLLAMISVDLAGRNYGIIIASNVADNVLPSVERLAHVSAIIKDSGGGDH